MLTMEQATNLSVVLHDALGRANDSILTHPLDPEEIQELIDELLNWIVSNNIPAELFEFQVLHGVPMNGRLEKLIYDHR